MIKREMRFSDTELRMLRDVFGKNELGLMTLRKFLLQGEMSAFENNILKSLPADGLSLIRKIFVPDIDANAPLGQSTDLFVSVATRDRQPSMVHWEMEMRHLVRKYLDLMLKILEGQAVKPLLLSELLIPSFWKSKTMVQIGARNILINHIDINISQIDVLANKEEETPEEKRIREEKNSNQ